jgi:hypothetical protein
VADLLFGEDPQLDAAFFVRQGRRRVVLFLAEAWKVMKWVVDGCVVYFFLSRSSFLFPSSFLFVPSFWLRYGTIRF